MNNIHQDKQFKRFRAHISEQLSPRARTVFISGSFIVIIAIVFWLAFSVANYYTESKSDRDHLSTYIQQKTVNQVCSYAVPEEQYFDCAVRFLESAEQSAMKSADLKAQQDMAIWAYTLLLVSGLGLLVSVVGIVLIYQTLRATQNMAVQSEKATSAAIAGSMATIQAVEQAKKANRISDAIAKNDRARLFVEFVTSDGLQVVLGRSEFYCNVCLKIQNLGRTPGIVSLVQPRLFWCPKEFASENLNPNDDNNRAFEGNLHRLMEGTRMFPIPDNDKYPFTSPSNNQIVIKGGQSTQEITARFYFQPDAYRTEMSAHVGPTHFHCLVHYKDVYNEDRLTSYFAKIMGNLAIKPPANLDEEFNFQK